MPAELAREILESHQPWDVWFTYSPHCGSFLGLPFRILNIELLNQKKGTTMETIGRFQGVQGFRGLGFRGLGFT